MGLPGGASGKEPKCQCRRQETRVRSVGQEGPLEEGMAACSSILAQNSVDRELGELVLGITESEMTEHACAQTQPSLNN